jgi:hypothetical protein
MASEQITQEALNIMLQDGTTKDNLKQVLSGVLENVSAKAVSEQIKAKNGSGTPEGGVIEYKRFVNAELKDKGTARKAGKGDAVKGKPVKVVIDTDKEIVEELQGKDVKLYGIDGMAERRKVNHQSAIIRYLDREFFAKVLEGTEVTAKDNVQDTIDDLLGRARTLKNNFIDGIESDLLVIVINSTYRKAMKKILDELPNGTDPKEQAIGMYDSVRVYESNRLPTDVEAVVMMDGAIAQPYYVSEYSAEKVPFDDAVALEDYLYKGTKALMEDTIFYVKKKIASLGELTINSVEGETAGNTKITVTPTIEEGHSYKYKVATSPTMPTYDQVCSSGYTNWNGTDEITATTGQKIVVVEVDSENKTKKAGETTITSKAE